MRRGHFRFRMCDCGAPRGAGEDGTFDPDQWMEPKEQRKVDDFIVYAMAAASEALDDAEATSDAHAAARDAVDKLRMAVTNEDGDAASERAREAAAAAGVRVLAVEAGAVMLADDLPLISDLCEKHRLTFVGISATAQK